MGVDFWVQMGKCEEQVERERMEAERVRRVAEVKVSDEVGGGGGAQ